MKKKNGVFLGLLIAALLLLTMACPTAINPTPTAITFESAVQTGGTDGVADSTGLTLTFSVDPTSLTANNITVTGATKGALSGSGTTRSLAISDITVANGSLVFIEISSPSGFTIKGSPKAVVVYKDTRLDVTFESAVQTGGTSGTADSTGLTLTFSVDPTTLTADNITVTGATKGALSGSGTTRTLAISDITVANGSLVFIEISSPSGFTIKGSPKAVVVYKDTRLDVTFESAVQTGGTSGTADSTGLTLTFSVDPTTLTADNITVTGATKGALSGSGTTRTLAISNITVGNGETVSVAIASPSGFTISGSPQTAVVYTDTTIPPTAVTFESAVQTGGTSGTANSTGLTLTFSVDPTTLTADNITVTGATKGALSGSGTTRTLAISNITVGNGETVSLTIANPSGFTISGSPQTAVVYTDTTIPPTAVTFESAVQTGGTSGTADSTGLTLTFSVDPTTLTADNITVTGATKGALSGSGTTRTLAISNITVGNGETVSLTIANPSGFTISGSPQTAVVYTDTTIPPTAVTFESAVQTGGTSGTADSTGLTLTFSVDPTTLTADNITVTGATKGALSVSGTTRTLAISNITVGNGETVSVAIASPSGFTISGSPQTAVVYTDTTIPPTAVTFESAVQTGGTSGTANSTGLTLTFSVDPTTLTADNITVTGATKGALSVSGTTRTLAISNITVGNGETVSVAIASPSGFTISGSPQTAVVYTDTTIPPTAVTFESAVQTGGTSGTANSTGLTLTFSVDPTTLTADNITVTGATKGALSVSGTTRTLAISNITVGNGETVSVAIASPSGFTISGSPQTAVVYTDTTIPPTAVTFESAVQTGGTSGTANSTGLTLTFSVDPTTLTADNITVTGATKGALSVSGTTRTLAISNITVGNGETVSVAIASPSGFTISGSPKTAVVYTDTTTAVTFESAVQTGGTSGTANSTGLTLTFSVDPTTLTADNITVTGATKGALSVSGTTRTLAISNITVGNGETVSVAIASPSGFTISGTPQMAVVYRAPYIGMAYQGGVIAYILQSVDPGYVSGETHGLIASTADLSTEIQWFNGSYKTTGATGTALGTGQANTTAIVSNQGAGSYAAQLCNDYTNADTGTGVYSDWYLPSKDELNKLYQNKTAVGGFAENSYWSSSELNSNVAWYQYFRNGGQYDASKNGSTRVRAVRAF